jgi:hypothetical protein
MSLLTIVQGLAFGRANVMQANEAIAAMREERGSEYGPALSYELALPALDPEVWLQTRALPKLVYFLDCRGAKLPTTPGVFVSLFFADELLFVEAGALVQAVAESRGLTLAEVVRRYGDGGAGDPALLGP